VAGRPRSCTIARRNTAAFLAADYFAVSFFVLYFVAETLLRLHDAR
jgi:hypothetical protein